MDDPKRFPDAIDGVDIPATVEAARAEVRALKAASVDSIKVMFDDLKYAGRPGKPAMSREILLAVLDEAHRRGLKVYAHATTLRYAKDFLRAGGDGLMHGIIDEPVDEEFLSLMKTGGRFYVPTLTLWEAIHDIAGFARREAEFDTLHRNPEAEYALFQDPKIVEQANVRFGGGLPEQNLKLAKENLKRVASSGIPVATGTDTGVPGVLQGVAAQLELVLFVEAGLSPAEALRASTLTAQRILGRVEQSGEVAVGKLADLVVLDGDPMWDIHNISKVFAVIKSGGGALKRPASLRNRNERSIRVSITGILIRPRSLSRPKRPEHSSPRFPKLRGCGCGASSDTKARPQASKSVSTRPTRRRLPARNALSYGGVT